MMKAMEEFPEGPNAWKRMVFPPKHPCIFCSLDKKAKNTIWGKAEEGDDLVNAYLAWQDSNMFTHILVTASKTAELLYLYM